MEHLSMKIDFFWIPVFTGMTKDLSGFVITAEAGIQRKY